MNRQDIPYREVHQYTYATLSSFLTVIWRDYIRLDLTRLEAKCLNDCKIQKEINDKLWFPSTCFKITQAGQISTITFLDTISPSTRETRRLGTCH